MRIFLFVKIVKGNSIVSILFFTFRKGEEDFFIPH